jgi:succinylglutamate desuccinylase
MTGKDVNLYIEHTTLRCSHCGDVLAVLNDREISIEVDFLGHLRDKHPEVLVMPESRSAIQSAIRSQSSITDAVRKAECDKWKKLIHPYLP